MANETEVELSPSDVEQDVATEQADVEEVTAEEAGAEEATAEEDEAALEGDLSEAMRQVANLTADLQRLQAEYLNYKRRVERDRDLVRENATYSALDPVTEVRDTIDRARQHGELD